MERETGYAETLASDAIRAVRNNTEANSATWKKQEKRHGGSVWRVAVKMAVDAEASATCIADWKSKVVAKMGATFLPA